MLFEKGDKLFIERIDISGNTATLDRVVKSSIFYSLEGDPFNPREIKAAEDRIRSLGLFSDVYLLMCFQEAKTSGSYRRKVSGKPTGSLTFGAGYSSAAGLGGIIEYGEKNFFGKRAKFIFCNKTGKDDQLYELSFYEPMFLRNDLGFGVNLSLKDTNQQNAAYDTENLNFNHILFFLLEKNQKLN